MPRALVVALLLLALAGPAVADTRWVLSGTMDEPGWVAVHVLAPNGEHIRANPTDVTGSTSHLAVELRDNGRERDWLASTLAPSFAPEVMATGAGRASLEKVPGEERGNELNVFEVVDMHLVLVAAKRDGPWTWVVEGNAPARAAVVATSTDAILLHGDQADEGVYVGYGAPGADAKGVAAQAVYRYEVKEHFQGYVGWSNNDRESTAEYRVRHPDGTIEECFRWSCYADWGPGQYEILRDGVRGSFKPSVPLSGFDSPRELPRMPGT